jgi:hypothetical protein
MAGILPQRSRYIESQRILPSTTSTPLQASVLGHRFPRPNTWLHKCSLGSK